MMNNHDERHGLDNFGLVIFCGIGAIILVVSCYYIAEAIL